MQELDSGPSRALDPARQEVAPCRQDRQLATSHRCVGSGAPGQRCPPASRRLRTKRRPDAVPILRRGPCSYWKWDGRERHSAGHQHAHEEQRHVLVGDQCTGHAPTAKLPQGRSFRCAGRLVSVRGGSLVAVRSQAENPTLSAVCCMTPFLDRTRSTLLKLACTLLWYR